MTTRHPLPGGQWVDVLDPDALSGADQDEFFDKYDELMAKVPQPEPQPDPANPAQMLPAPPRTLDRAGNRELLDWILAKAITGWSFDHLALPYRGEYRTGRDGDGKPLLPLRTGNALVRAARPVQAALLDDEDEVADGAPKSAAQGGTGGSEGTSPAGTGSLLPAPPAVQSATP